MSDVIRFENVHRHFGRQPVLAGLDLSVPPGQVYALLGRNGAGKTTALRILLGFLQPHAGSSQLLGCDSRHLAPQHRARIGYVGEGHRLPPTLRVAELIAFERRTRPGFRQTFVDTAVQRCGLRRSQLVLRLSRGQRAQLSLILAVASEPEVLVFDDPAMGLDPVMRRELLDALIDLLAETGCAVLFSSHMLADVERIADRVGILHDGALLVDATLDDLKRRVQRLPFASRNGFVPEPGGQILRVGRRRGGYDLLLLDADEALRQRLAAHGELGEPGTPTLEQLFLDLIGPERPGLLSEPLAALQQEVTP